MAVETGRISEVEPIADIAGWVRTGGMLPSANNYVQDGASSNDREQGGSMNVQRLESAAEVRMETSRGSAKYSSPVTVIVTTKASSIARCKSRRGWSGDRIS